jgi:hypothetical protein
VRALNADPRERVPASELLREAVKIGLTAAERSGGLVNPTLIGAMDGKRLRVLWTRLRAGSLPVTS